MLDPEMKEQKINKLLFNFFLMLLKYGINMDFWSCPLIDLIFQPQLQLNLLYKKAYTIKGHYDGSFAYTHNLK